MSTREDVIKKIEIMPEETLRKVIAFIGMYDNEEYESVVFTDELRARIDEGLKKGMEDIEAGRTISSEELEEEMQGWFKKYDV